MLYPHLNNSKLYIWLVCHVFFLSSPSAAQSPYSNWKSSEYGVHHGLPNPEVSAIERTSTGELLVGHKIGLSIWNGSDFQELVERDGVHVGNVRNIKTDSALNSWIGSDRGLFLFRNGDLKHLELPDTLYLPIFQIEPTSENTISISTNAGLYSLTFDMSTFQINNVDKLISTKNSKEVIYSISYNESTNEYALGSAFQVITFRNRNKNIIWDGDGKPSVRTLRYIEGGDLIWGSKREGAYHYHDGVAHKLIEESSSITSYVGWHNNQLWIASDSIYSSVDTSFNVNAVKSTFEPINGILSFCVFDEHNIFVGSRNGMTHVYKTAFDYSIGKNESAPKFVTSSFINSAGQIYLGSQRGKIFKIINNKFKELNFESIHSSDVLSIFQNGNQFWAGTSFEGLLHCQGNNCNQYSTDNILNDNTIRFVDLIDENTIVAAGDDYINFIDYDEVENSVRLSKQYKTNAKYSNYLYFNQVIQYQDLFLVASNEGLYKIEHDSLQKVSFDHYENDFELKAIIPSNEGLFLLTNGDGIYYVKKDGEEFNVVQNFNLIRHRGPQSVLSAFKDSKDNIWIADFNGLWILNKQHQLFLLDQKDGYRNATINNINFFEDQAGYIWLTSNNGVLKIDSEFILKNKYTAIESNVQINNQVVNTVNNKPIFNHKQNDLRIKFNISNPISNNNLFMAYQLKPLDDDWNNMLGNDLFIQDMNPGEYELLYKISHHANLSLVDYEVIKFKIKKPLYLNNIAIGIYFFLFGSLLYWLYIIDLKSKEKKAESKRIQDLSKIKEDFFTQISHDFRTPLTVIRSATGDLTSLPIQQELITRNSDKLLNMVNQILVLNKYDNTNQKLEFVQEDVIQHLKKICSPFIDIAASQDKQLIIRDRLGTLMMDVDLYVFDRIIYNLLDNALKYTNKEDQIILDVDNENNCFTIRVDDTGIGISETEIEHIFTRYQQGQTLNKNQGLGIGLTIVKHLVQKLGGTISCESELGIGTSFHLSFPIFNNAIILNGEHKSEMYTTDIQQRSFSKSPVSMDRSRDTVLIVEDNLDLNHYLISLLEADYNVIHTFNGEEALQQAINFIPDIIISDVMMPVMDGIQLCERVKSNTMINHIPFVFLTAKAGLKNLKDGLRVGALEYITKPFDKEEILIRIKNILQTKTMFQAKYQNLMGIHAANGMEPDLQIDFLQKTQNFILENMEGGKVSVDNIVKLHGTNHVSLNKKLKDLTGFSTAEYVRKIKLKHAYTLVTTTKSSIAEVAYCIGSKDPSHFSRIFKAEFQSSPSELRVKLSSV